MRKQRLVKKMTMIMMTMTVITMTMTMMMMMIVLLIPLTPLCPRGGTPDFMRI